jgi:hypothetical protein
MDLIKSNRYLIYMHREIIIRNKYVVYAGKYNTSFIMNDTFAIKMKYMCYEVQIINLNVHDM